MARAETLHLSGKSNCAIGVALGVSEATIRNDLTRCDELYRERVGEDVKVNRAIAIRRLEIVATKALEAYELDNAREHAVLFNEPFIDADGKEHEVAHDKNGAAQYRANKSAALSVAEKAAMDIAKLQGLVIDKASLTDTDGNDLAALILKARSDADR